MRARIWIEALAFALLAAVCATVGPAIAQAPAQPTNAGPVQPWGLPPLPPGVGPIEKFADVSNTPHYDVKGNLWASAFRLGGILQIDPRGIILGFMPIPNGDIATTNFAFGGPDNRDIFLKGATSGTFWRFKAPYPGLIGPGGTRLPAQP